MRLEIGLCTNNDLIKDYGATSSDFDGRRESSRERAKKICRDCPRQLTCFNEAVGNMLISMSDDDRSLDVTGIWGGYAVVEIGRLLLPRYSDELRKVKDGLEARQEASKTMREELRQG